MNQDSNNALPPLPSLDNRLTLAPKDDLVPVDTKTEEKIQETPTETPTPATVPDSPTTPNQSNPDNSFTPPAGWGASQTPPPQTPTINLPEPHDDKEHQDSPLVKFVKVFLIAVALVLLGVLIGVVSSRLLVGSSTDTQTQSQIRNQPVPTSSDSQDNVSPSENPDSLMADLQNRSFEYRNNSAGPLSFDLIYSGLWQESTISGTKNDLNLSLTRDNLTFNLFYNPKDIKTKSELCLSSEDIAPKNLPYLKYKYSVDVDVAGLNWRLAKDMASTESASYKVCEQNKENQYQSLTSFGFISIKTENGQDLTKAEETQILQLLTGFEKKSSTPSSSLKP